MAAQAVAPEPTTDRPGAPARSLWRGAILALLYGWVVAYVVGLALAPKLGLVFVPALFLLVVAPVVEEHAKLGGVALLRRFGWDRRDLRTLGAAVGLGFALAETAIFAGSLVAAGHASALGAILALRALLTIPMHTATGWLHGHALHHAPSRTFLAVYRHGSFAAILLHGAFNGLLLAIQRT